jgi:hypothetical protein
MMTETMMATTLRAHLHPPRIFCANFSNTDAPQRREVEGMNTPSQADTSAVAMTAGTTERELVATVARAFPDLECREFVAALQDATAAAEKHAARKH